MTNSPAWKRLGLAGTLILMTGVSLRLAVNAWRPAEVVLDERAAFMHEILARGGSIDFGSPSIRESLARATGNPRSSDARYTWNLPVYEVALPRDADLRDARRMHFLSEVTSVVIRSDRFDDQSLLALPAFSNLGAIRIESLSVTARGLARLVQWRPSQIVILAGKRIDDQVADYLMQCPASYYIDIRGTSITSAGLKRLLMHPRAESLHADGLGASADAIDGLNGSQVKLKILSIAGNQFGDHEAAFFYRIPTLQVLDLSSAIHGPEAAAAVAQNSSLVHLAINGISGDLPRFFEGLQKQSSINELSLRDVVLSVENMKCLLRMPELRRLDLAGGNIDAEMEASIRSELESEGFFRHGKVDIFR